jgi:serine/threonine protein kinase
MTERQIGNYRILKQIGAGGMAKVYLAVHKDVPNLKVVLKILSSPQHAERFMQEADKLALLERNPNICHIRHFFNHEDELVIAMEYIEGKSLEEMIAEKGNFSVEETIKIIADLLAALAFAHDKEIYHRDIKPGNVMFDRDGLLKIIDFGIAKGKTDPQMTIVGTATGTPEYMAPEQFAGGEHLDYAKCDIYAVGTMMYTMLTGRPPFKGENEFVLRDAKLFEDPPPPSRLSKEISGELDRVILKAMDKDPAKRFASVAEMKSELLKLAGKPDRPEKAPATEASSASPAKPAATHGKRGKIVGAAAALVIIAAAAIFGIKMMSGGDGGNVTIPVEDSASTRMSAPVDTPRVVESTVPDSGERIEPEEDKPGVDTLAERTGAEDKRKVAVTDPIKPAAATGTLRVGSIPMKAKIYINNEERGKTNYSFALPPGVYTVRLEKVVDGKTLTFTDTVRVESGKIQKVFKDFSK